MVYFLLNIQKKIVFIKALWVHVGNELEVLFNCRQLIKDFPIRYVILIFKEKWNFWDN